MDIEQRKYVRFSVQHNTFAALGSEFEKVGKVNDISQKGLALSYLTESIKAGSERDFSKVDIFLSGNGFHLHRVPCKIVYDIQDSKSNNNSIMKRRCGLHFGKLSKSQSELLELFLKNFTTGPLSS
jgi:PilZ domain